MRRAVILQMIAGLLVIAAPLGCQPTNQTQPPEPGPASEPQPSRLEGVCGTSGSVFADHAWAPADARLVTSVLRHDPELSAALDQLAQFATDSGSSLPVSVAMDYQNLGMSLLNLERLLAELGLDPGELVELHDPAGRVSWVWPTDCDPAELSTRMLSRWQVMLQPDFGRPGVRLGTSPEGTFPFDVVVLGDTRVVLTTQGHASAAAGWLHDPQSAPSGVDGPGESLGLIDPAPVRSVIRPASTPYQTLIRATATATETKP